MLHQPHVMVCITLFVYYTNTGWARLPRGRQSIRMCKPFLQVKRESHTLKPLKMHTYILIMLKCFILWVIRLPVLFSLFHLPATSALIAMLKCIADFEMFLQQGWKDFGKPMLHLDQD